MERARDASGKFMKVERAVPVEDEGGLTAGEFGRAPRPENCMVYTRARFAKALPALMQTLVREAKRGSVAHMKLLVVISGLNQGAGRPADRKRRGRNLEQILMENWRRDEEREAKERSKLAPFVLDEDVED